MTALITTGDFLGVMPAIMPSGQPDRQQSYMNFFFQYVMKVGMKE
ncbi:hypothetical protein [Deinococcus soli (ex Cha et al. 2016)]|nr:hypothetical protein [Deinococcus soli (ex Cha et al. 2016)]